MRSFFAFTSLLLLLLVACGGSALGDGCDKEGDTSDCDDGLVCGPKKPSKDLVCLKRCIETSDCPATQECSGLSGSLKACQNKS